MPLHAAKLRDLTCATTVTVHCECGHVAEVAVEMLWKRLPMTTGITDLYGYLRCANCDEKGCAEVECRRALGYDRLD